MGSAVSWAGDLPHLGKQRAGHSVGRPPTPHPRSSPGLWRPGGGPAPVPWPVGRWPRGDLVGALEQAAWLDSVAPAVPGPRLGQGDVPATSLHWQRARPESGRRPQVSPTPPYLCSCRCSKQLLSGPQGALCLAVALQDSHLLGPLQGCGGLPTSIFQGGGGGRENEEGEGEQRNKGRFACLRAGLFLIVF